MNNRLSLYVLIAFALVIGILPVSGAITTNAVNVNTTCVKMSGTNSGAAESVYFDYGHSSNPGYSSSTANQTVTGLFNVTRCDEPTFLPGEQYSVRACGRTSGCGAEVNFTMTAIVPHATTTFAVYGEAFVLNGGDPAWIAAHIWDVYTMTWGSYFLLLLIAFVFINVTIKQKSIVISFLLMLISGGVLWRFASPELVNIAQILMALALAGLVYWLYKGRR